MSINDVASDTGLFSSFNEVYQTHLKQAMKR